MSKKTIYKEMENNSAKFVNLTRDHEVLFL